MSKKYVVNFKKGDVLFTENFVSKTLYNMESGRVAVYKNYGKPDQVKLSEITEGFFGEMALVSYAKRTATAVVMEDSEIELIDRDELPEYLKENPFVAEVLLKAFTGRIRNLNREYLKVCGCINECVIAEENGNPKNPILVKQLKKLVADI